MRKWLLTSLLILTLCTCGRAQAICPNNQCGDLTSAFEITTPVAIFCEGNPITFQNNSVAGWDFFIIDWQDGTVDTINNYNNVTHVYNFEPEEDEDCVEPQQLRVEFRGITDCAGGQTCHSGSLDIAVFPKPVARINVSNEVCAGRQIQFSSGSCNAAAFSWDFGDGNTSTEETPTHTYADDGSYTITLTVTGSGACNTSTDMISRTIDIVNPPNALFAVSDDDLIACRGETITFSNQSNDDTNITWDISPANGWEFVDTNMTVSSEIIGIVFNTDQLYTVTLTGSNACDEVTAEQIIDIREAPSVAPLDDIEGCDEVSVSPAALGYSVNGETTQICWDFPDGNATNVCTESFGPVTFTSSGRVILRVTSLCGDVTREAMVTVQSSEAPTLGTNSPYCTGSSPDTLTASAPGGSWGGAGIINPGLGVFDPATAGPGTHTLTYSITDGACQNMNSVTVTVEQSAVVTTPDREFCLDGEIASLSANPAGGTWSGTGITDPSGTFDPGMAGTGVARPTYFFTDSNGCEVEVSPDLTVNAVPLISSRDTALVCNEDETVDLIDLTEIASNVAGGTFSWTLNGTALGGSSFNPFNDLPGAGNYPINWQYENGPCTVIGELTLSLIERPVLELPDVPVLCLNGDPITLTANLPGGIWSGSGITDGGAGTFDPEVAGISSPTLTYRITEGTCRNEGSIQVEVVAGATVTAIDADFCLDGETADLSALPLGGSWSGDGITDPGNGTFDPALAGVGLSNPTYTFQDDDGCTITASPDVEVFAVPEVTGVDTAIACLVNEAVDLANITGIASNVAGGSYAWTVDGTVVPSGSFNPQTDLGGPGVYPVSYVYRNGPCEVPGELFLEIIDNPQLVLDPQDNVCISQNTLALGANLSGGMWSGPNIDPGSGLIDLNTTGGGTFTYTYTFQPGGSCEQTEQQIITIEDPGATIAVGPDQPACEDRDLTLTLNGATPGGGTWTGDGVTNGATGTVDLTQLIPGQTYIYTYGIESSTTPGCNAEATKQVIYNPAPDPNFTLDGAPCINESFGLNAAQLGNSSYAWDFGDETTSSLPNPTHTYLSGGTFTQTLTVTNNTTGCPADTATTVYVTTPPAPAFTLDSTLGCAPFVLTLNDESTGDDFTSFWTVAGDTLPGGSTQDVILDGFLEDTEIEVLLVAENFCGARSQVQSVVVKPYPVVNFGFATDDGCSPFQPELSNVTLGNPDAFFWDMGQGTTSTDSIPPLVEYLTPEDSVSVFPVTLIAVNECGRDTLVKPVTVHPPDVRAFIGLDTIAGCQPWTFQPQSFSTPGASLAWEVLAPDGSIFASGNEANPSFELTQAGLHRVILRAARCGSDADTVFVDVLPAPEVSFTTDPAVCLNAELTLTNTSSGLAGGFYALGNGDTLDQLNGTISYPAPGDYGILFTGFSSLNNCPATVSQTVTVQPLPTVAIAATDTSGCSPFPTTFSHPDAAAGLDYAWDFDDATANSDATSPTHTYNEPGEYFPRLTVTDEIGCSNDTFFSRIIVHPDPEPAFSIVSPRLCAGVDSLRLMNQSLGTVALSWNINGVPVNGLPPVLALSGAGEQTVTLMATSVHGCTAIATETYQVLASPVATITATPDTACLGTNLTFTSTSRSATDLIWDLADDTGSNESSFTHRYGAAGDYPVTLIATNDNGCPADTAQINVMINPLPVAAFSLAESVRCGTPALVSFTNASSGALSYTWTFGDGNGQTTLNPEHTYTSAGTYFPQLIAETDFGCQDTTEQELIISGDPVADFVRPPVLGCSPYLLQLEAEPTQALRYEWYLDDAFAPSIGPSFDTLLTENRTHSLRLVAIYDDLCRDTLDVPDLITLEARPVAGFVFQADELTNRLGEVSFQSTSTGGDEYFWDLGDGTIRSETAFYHEYRINRDITVTHAITRRYDQGLVCSDTLRQNVEPEWITRFFVPNAISPESGPDEVRLWGAKGFGVTEYRLEVFSAYGQLLFTTEELQDSQPVGRWDGTLSTTGELALQGAYTWRAKVTYVDGNTENLVGTVTVVR